MRKDQTIDVIDAGHPALVQQIRGALEGLGSTLIELPLMCNGVAVLVDRVLAALSPCPGGRLGVLRLWGHGDFGGAFLGLSAGRWSESDRAGTHAHGEGLSPANLAFCTVHGALARLRPCFAAGGRAELRGCKMAAFIEGKKLMKQLAVLWGVRVLASATPETDAIWRTPVWQETPAGSGSTAAPPSLRDP